MSVTFSIPLFGSFHLELSSIQFFLCCFIFLVLHCINPKSSPKSNLIQYPIVFLMWCGDKGENRIGFPLWFSSFTWPFSPFMSFRFFFSDSDLTWFILTLHYDIGWLVEKALFDFHLPMNLVNKIHKSGQAGAQRKYFLFVFYFILWLHCNYSFILSRREEGGAYQKATQCGKKNPLKKIFENFLILIFLYSIVHAIHEGNES